MSSTEEPPPDEAAIIRLVEDLNRTGNVQPLVALLRDTTEGPELVRQALIVLGELNLDLLVQLTLDTLIDDYVDDPATAHQTGRFRHLDQ